MDMVTISTAVSTLKTSIDIAKALKDSDEIFEKAEIKLQLAELISSLADAKMQIAEIQEQLIINEKEKNALLEKIKLKDELIFDKAYYWRKINEDEKDGPFCQTCYDLEEKLIRLQGGNNDYWTCYSCKSSFEGKKYIRPQMPQIF
jgi:hypothetical protein